VPPIYEIDAHHIDDRHGLEFSRQWAFEWSKLHARAGRKPRAPDVDFWMRWGPDRLVTLDVVESEFYRSAFLRALAWAASRRRLSSSSVKYYCARVCPVNLDLWIVNLAPSPSWWPTITSTEGPLDRTPGEVLGQVERLWANQRGSEWFIAEASGEVSGGDVTYDVNICGVLQSCNGPSQPDFGRLFETCQMGVSPGSELLRVEGAIRAGGEDYEVKLGDWIVRPMAVRLLHGTIPRWQWWRGARGVWSPSPALLQDDFSVKLGDRELQFECGGDVFARWSDWMQSFHERSHSGLPPSTGQVLSIRRDIIQQAAERTSASVAWLCRWRAFRRKSQYSDEVEEAAGVVAFGTSLVVRR